ncbi:hypothetical protein L3i23_05720 [Herbiconiux sp. L3-i23]|nr:hypothetical protein L3i23_05720 [Herbiconiux sp. L3-i23]
MVRTPGVVGLPEVVTVIVYRSRAVIVVAMTGVGVVMVGLRRDRSAAVEVLVVSTHHWYNIPPMGIFRQGGSVAQISLAAASRSRRVNRIDDWRYPTATMA